MIVAAGKLGPRGVEQAWRLLAQVEIEMLSFTPSLQQLAIEASLRFGRGRHPAALNFGDCMSYATAKSLDAPLLFKGADFAQTDVRIAAV